MGSHLTVLSPKRVGVRRGPRNTVPSAFPSFRTRPGYEAAEGKSPGRDNLLFVENLFFFGKKLGLDIIFMWTRKDWFSLCNKVGKMFYFVKRGGG